MTTEKQILAHAKAESKKYGLRFLRISMRQGVETGWPDTFIFAPNRWVLGLETKRPGQEATPIQKKRGREMMAYGQAWAKADTKENVSFTLRNFAAHAVDLPTIDLEAFREEQKRDA